MIVGMDVDDVVADLLTEWLRRYNLRSGDNLTPEDIDTWDLTKVCKGMPQQDFYDILHEGDLYDHVMPHAGAHRMITEILSMGCRVVYISSCVGLTAFYKQEWLQRMGFLSAKNKYRDFVAAHDKSLVTGVDVLFDDRPLNVRQFPKESYLVRRPHNRNERVGLASCWLSEIPTVVKRLRDF
jgi:5'(3')-deoxyribonucleotidase